MATIEIDGSYLEGGGQILRTAVALSAVSQKPFYIENIRANRVEPGIRPSHMASIEAVAEICGADHTAKIGNTTLEFKPGRLKGGHVSLNTGTAGSIPLILQAVMIPALYCKDLEVDIKGGTATKWAPTIHYIENVTFEILRKMGYNGSIEILKHGFFPKGGGHVIFRSQKSKLKGINGIDPGRITTVDGIGTVTKDLKKNDIGERLKNFSRERLFKKFRVVPHVAYEYVDSLSTGAAVDVFAKTENSVWGANSLGETRKRIEYVVDEAVNRLGKQAKHNKFLDEFMSDQIIPYMGIVGKSTVSVAKITPHTRTNIWTTEKFLPIKFDVDEKKKIISV